MLTSQCDSSCDSEENMDSSGLRREEHLLTVGILRLDDRYGKTQETTSYILKYVCSNSLFH